MELLPVEIADEVEQMNFDAQGLFAEGGIWADVNRGDPSLPLMRDMPGEDAAAGDEVVDLDQIRGGKPDGSTSLLAFADKAEQWLILEGVLRELQPSYFYPAQPRRDLRPLHDLIGRAKQEDVTPADLLKWAREHANGSGDADDQLAVLHLQAAQAFEGYQARLAQKDLLEFEDMIQMLAREIPGAAHVVEGDAAVRCTGVHHDSRRVRPGDLFVVRCGEKYDGSAFVGDAMARGAAAVLADHTVSLDVPCIRVDDVATGLAYAAAAVYGHPAFSLDVVGVTGTNGKTTTTHLVRAAIDGALGLPKCGVVGTIGHSYAGRTIAAAHTTPEADELARVLAVMRKRGATHVAMEVSSIALVVGRVKAVRFRVAAFTNLTQDHLDFHGSMDAYAAAKMALFTTSEPGLAVVNVDDPFGVKLAAAAKCKVLRVRTKLGAAEGDADIAPVSVDASASGMRIVARVPGGTVLHCANRLTTCIDVFARGLMAHELFFG